MLQRTEEADAAEDALATTWLCNLVPEEPIIRMK